jgi:hypothetical protein
MDFGNEQRKRGPMPGHDASVEFEDLRLQHPQLRAESNNTFACGIRHAIVIGIGYNIE